MVLKDNLQVANQWQQETWLLYTYLEQILLPAGTGYMIQGFMTFFWVFLRPWWKSFSSPYLKWDVDKLWWGYKTSNYM